jgi:two-component system, chemotaxis family, CheB/CheR fusion protein
MNTQSRKKAVYAKSAFKSKGENRARTLLPAAQAEKPGDQIHPKTRLLKSKTLKHFPVVGVGASAGGLEAFTQLLQNLPVDTGMAFVLVQHLDPEHESVLTQLLAKTTSMPVSEVTNNLRVEANHVYIIPPNTCMAIARGVLKLRPREQQGRMPHHSIDYFFESLAQDQQELAIGVILSGTATDGTQGLEIIKSEGGITFAQDDSASYDSMPSSAVAAGCVDLVLSPKEIAKKLVQIAKHPYVAGQGLQSKLEKERDDRGDAATLPVSGGRETPRIGSVQARAGALARPRKAGTNDYAKILLLLRNHCRVDFSFYKPSTIQRRITRRMVLNKQNALGDYARFLKGNSKELDLLYSDVLISVTSFFRNPEAFDALKLKVFPSLIQHHRQNDPVRVWTLGCSTGQEAYSIAMAFTEFCDKIPRAPKLQIFATDLNEPLLEKARHGLYTRSQVTDISPARLKRFFVEEQGGYRVCKSLREMCIFARQNVLSDPPFSRLDLISCRNLLIYIEPGLQKGILPNFHYALKPGGFLFLGASESIGAFTNLFTAVDKKQKIFSKKSGPIPAYQLPISKGQPAEKKAITAPRQHVLPEGTRAELSAQREAERVIVNQFAPPSVLINAELEVLQFRGPTGAFLEPPTGKASFNVLKMARAGLMLPLRAAINEAKKKNNPVRRKNVRLDDSGHTRLLTIEVIPLKNLKERCYLILFEEALEPWHPGHSPLSAQPAEARGAFKTTGPAARSESRRVTELERELAETRDYAESLQEQHEAASAELQASNEEAQSANEELQSINEELETSKEELESSNEELITVNEEMANRNTELSRLNNDLINLQSSTKLPIVLLSRDLIIRRFSPEAEKIFNLLATDLGRPIGNVRHNLELPDLEEFIEDVITSVRERECEVRDKQGRWHFLHVRPYITADNRVDGAVLVLVDISAIKESEQAVIAARDFAEAIIRTARDPFLILDADLRVESANEAFYTTFKVSRAESLGRTVFELDHGHWDIPRLRELLQDILPRKSFFNNFEVTHNFEHIGPRTMLLNARTLSETHGQPARILLGIQDVSELLHFQEQLRRSELRYRRLFESSRDGVLVIDPDTRKILDANPFMSDLLGYPHEALVGKELFEIGLLKDEAASRAAFEELQKNGLIRYENLPLQTKTGQRREVEFISNLYQEGGGTVIRCNIRDITERKKMEDDLQQAHAQLADRADQLEQAVVERTTELTATNKQLQAFVYTIAHDLRAPLRSMQGFSSMLVEESGTALSETGRDFAHQISTSAQFMDALLMDLLTFSAIAQQRVELTPVNLEGVVQSVLSHLEKEIQEKNARMEIVGAWPAVLAHKTTLGQVLTNLVGNALKFAAPGVSLVVRLRTEERAEFVRVWVEDNGIGIAPDHQDQIFQLFTRLHGDKFPGTGLGLAIVQKGIERMGGSVGVESTPGQGSRFWFELRKA